MKRENQLLFANVKTNVDDSWVEIVCLICFS